MAATDGISDSARKLGWRTPLMIVFCGSLIGLLTFGPRSSVGFFIQPMSLEFSWGRDVFALAFAVQNLLWGIGQPFAGAIADKFGAVRCQKQHARQRTGCHGARNLCGDESADEGVRIVRA